MLLAATSAPKTALSQCSWDMNSYSYSTCGSPRDVTGDEDVVGHHTVDVEGPAAGVAGRRPRIRWPARRPPATRHCGSSPARPPPRRLRGRCHQRVGPGAPCPRRPRAPRTATPVRRSTPASICICRGDIADHPAQRADQRGLAALGDRHLEVEIAAHRGDLGADEPGADDQHPARAVPSNAAASLAASSHVRTREHALQGGFLGVEPRPRPGAGGDQQPVVVDRVAVGQQHLMVGPVQTDRGDAQLASRRRPGRSRGSFVWSAGTQPLSTCLDSGGRS